MPEQQQKRASSAHATLPTSSTPPSSSRRLDSHSLFWDDLNKPKFLTLITGFYLALRLGIYPTTLIKTRQQAHLPLPGVSASASKGGDQPKRTILNVTRATFKVGGFRALYQGFHWNIIGLPVDPIYIGTLEYSRQIMTRYLKQHPGVVSNKYGDLFVTLTAGGAAAVVQQTFMVPIDVVTQRLMVLPTIIKAETTGTSSAAASANNTPAQPQHSFHSYSSASASLSPVQKPRLSAHGIIRDILHHDGIQGLYKGYFLTLAAVVPFSALQWALYWGVQSVFMKYLHEHPTKAQQQQFTPQQIDKNADDWREMLTAPASAAVAATLSSLATQPFDTLKTRLQIQTKRTPLRETLHKLIKDKGMMGLMSGGGARILTMMPSAVVSMSAYEACKRMSVLPQISQDNRHM